MSNQKTSVKNPNNLSKYLEIVSCYRKNGVSIEVEKSLQNKMGCLKVVHYPQKNDIMSEVGNSLLSNTGLRKSIEEASKQQHIRRTTLRKTSNEMTHYNTSVKKVR